MHKGAVLLFLLVTAVLGVVAVWLIKLSAPTGLIGFGLQSYTNTSAIVGITNRSFHQFNYILMVERKIGSSWPKGLLPGTIIPDHQFGTLGPGQFTNLTLPVMVYAPPQPWRISVFCNRPPIQPNSGRFKTGLLAFRLGMRKLAQELWGENFKGIQVSTTEMQQWEK
jgi:hypothetical protein